MPRGSAGAAARGRRRCCQRASVSTPSRCQAPRRTKHHGAPADELLEGGAAQPQAAHFAPGDDGGLAPLVGDERHLTEGGATAVAVHLPCVGRGVNLDPLPDLLATLRRHRVASACSDGARRRTTSPLTTTSACPYSTMYIVCPTSRININTNYSMSSISSVHKDINTNTSSTSRIVAPAS